MEEYCKSDVELLEGGCESFAKELEQHAKFNPLERCMTIASACNLYWRMHHLPPDPTAVEPVHGWRGAQVNQLLKALQWLYYQEHRLANEDSNEELIKHVRNGGEQTVLTPSEHFFVDGYIPSPRTVYEFHGCLFHGCTSCYPNNRELFRATHAKTSLPKAAGYNVIETWECEWDH